MLKRIREHFAAQKAQEQALEAEYAAIRAELASATVLIILDDGQILHKDISTHGHIYGFGAERYPERAVDGIKTIFFGVTKAISARGFTTSGHIHYLPHRIDRIVLSEITIRS